MSRLRNIIEAATPGPWLHTHSETGRRFGITEDAWDEWQRKTFAEGWACGRSLFSVEAPKALEGAGATCAISGNGPTGAANAEYIATFDPELADAFLRLYEAIVVTHKPSGGTTIMLGDTANAHDALTSLLTERGLL